MLSTYLENAILNHVLGAVAFTPPSSMQLALFTSACTDDALGTEVSGGGYSRVSITNNTTNWANSSAGVKKNATVITFPALSASWGSVTHWALMDGTNILCHGAFTTARTFAVGEVPRISALALQLTAPTGWSAALKNAVFDHVFGATTHTPDATVYLGLCAAAPTADPFTEVETIATDGYARVAITNNTTNFPSAADGAKSNGAAFTFPAATGDWGASPATHWVLSKSSTSLTAANMLMYGSIASPVVIVNTDTAAFAIGDFDVALD